MILRQRSETEVACFQLLTARRLALYFLVLLL